MPGAPPVTSVPVSMIPPVISDLFSISIPIPPLAVMLLALESRQVIVLLVMDHSDWHYGGLEPDAVVDHRHW